MFNYKWNLKDGYPAKGISKNNLNVFGTFLCGGGSTMGYKLAGFNHLGGVEIDVKIADVYKTNHNPKYLYIEDLRKFNDRNDLPEELFNLDILDGSPPCSTFSLSGSREDAWGKEKKFREGQSLQSLDDLVFVYCDTIIKLKPKVFILENVKGIIQGNAKVYAKQIVQKMENAGYIVQVFCLNAATMGVPQKRERVFFIGHKKELNFKKLKLEFNEKLVPYKEYCSGRGKEIPLRLKDLWEKRIDKDLTFEYTLNRLNKKDNDKYFNSLYIQQNKIMTTIPSCPGSIFARFDIPYQISKKDIILAGSFPEDYNFLKMNQQYIIGMSVPPVMIAQIANQINLQWFQNTKL